MLGVRCQASGVRCQALGIRCRVSGVRHRALGIRCRVSGIRCRVSCLGESMGQWISRGWHRDTPWPVACADSGKRCVPAHSGFDGKSLQPETGNRQTEKRCVGETERPCRDGGEKRQVSGPWAAGAMRGWDVAGGWPSRRREAERPCGHEGTSLPRTRHAVPNGAISRPDFRNHTVDRACRFPVQ